MLLPEGQAENGMSPDVPSQIGPGMELDRPRHGRRCGGAALTGS